MASAASTSGKAELQSTTTTSEETGRDNCASCRQNRNTLEEKETEDAIIICVDPEDMKKPPKNKKNHPKMPILEKVCALRNYGGGRLYIHVKTQDKSNWYHGWLDSIIDNSLLAMIEDGSMFTDAFSKQWVTRDNIDGIKGIEAHEDYCHEGYLCIDVSGGTQFCSVDINTPMQTDHSVLPSTAYSIFRFLENRNTDLTNDIPNPRGNLVREGNVPGYTTRRYYESRNMQFKGLEPPKEKKNPNEMTQQNTKTTEEKTTEKKMTVTGLFDNLNTCKLKDYVSAFAKQKTGGYFYFGISENINRHKHEADIIVRGFSLKSDDKQSKKQPGQNDALVQPVESQPAHNVALVQPVESQPAQNVETVQPVESQSAENVVLVQPVESQPAQTVALVQSVENQPAPNVALVQPVESQPAQNVALVQHVESQPAQNVALVQPVESQPAQTVALVQPVESQPAENVALVRPVESQPAENMALVQLVESQPAENVALVLPVDSQPAQNVAHVQHVESQPAQTVVMVQPVESQPAQTVVLVQPVENQPVGNVALVQPVESQAAQNVGLVQLVENQAIHTVPPEIYDNLKNRNNIDKLLYNAFIKLINEELDESLVAYSYDGAKMDIIRSRKLYRAMYYDADKGRIFLEIAVAPVAGLVFTDVDGPRSFIWRPESKCAHRLTPKEWIEKVNDTFRTPL